MIKKDKLLKLPKHKCQKCDSSEYKVLNSWSVEVSGVIDGKAYKSFYVKRVTCKSCGQCGAVKDYVAAEDQN